jgi:hypothetical protein
VVTVDLLLVLGYFRSATPFLSVIRHLAPHFKIAVLHTDASASLRNKTGEAEALFLRLCREFGAQVLGDNERVEAKLAVIQQFAYDPALATRLDERIVATRRVGLAGLTFAGLEKHDAFIAQFGLRKAYVPSLRLMTFLLGRRNATQRYAGVELEEVGLPFATYPVFPDFSVDWLIAAPTIFSFSDERDKQAFLRSVLRLLAQIDEADVVAYKPHNGNVLDYFVPRFHYAMASVAERIPGGNRLLSGLAENAPAWLRRHVSRTFTSALHCRVLRRAVPMSTLTPYADISIEAFLPGVRKGVIGGLSNTIWGTLYLERPYFNCVNRPSGPARHSELVNKSSETLLDLNLEYFGVPFCGGRLSDGARGESIVLDQDRRGDLLQAIRRDVSGLAELT